MFSFTFSRIAVIFAILLVGILARWRKLLNEESTNGLCRIAIELALPFLYFYTLSANLNRQLFSSIYLLPLFAMFLTFAAYFISRMVSLGLNLTDKQLCTFRFLITFPNYGFLAIPLVFALFGQEGLVRVFMFNLGITFLYWTFGVAILTPATTNGISVLKNLVNPGTVALVLGTIAGVSAFKIPGFIAEAAKLIGNAAIPLALIVIGSMLARRDFAKNIPLKAMLMLIFCRLILMPVLAILFINAFDGLSKILRVIIVLQAAMPAASTAPILARRFGADTELAASGVFFTTLLSIITVPIFISLALR